jgi:hypothetical protein
MKELFEPLMSYFRAPSAESLALKELEDAKRKLLEALSAREYTDSMCKYHETRIKRLTAYLHSVTEVK